MIICFMLVMAFSGQQVNGDMYQQMTLSSASFEFSQRLYKKIALDSESLAYSPYSIHSALSMALMGASGNTANEMTETLGVGAFQHCVHSIYKELLQQMNSVLGVHINTASALFVKPKYSIEQQFLDNARDNYFAEVDNFDFFAKGGPEKHINDYIANKTENMIKDLLSPGTITVDTVLILVNAVYFNGLWEKHFETYRTWREGFKLIGGAVKQVQMMHDFREIKIKRDYANGVDVAELPFKGGRFSMYIALPQQVDGITELEALLTHTDKFKTLFYNLQYESIDVAIPKFKIETSLQLKSVLVDMGMKNAFDEMAADFTGINKEGGIFIDEVFHKATILVQEAGTVASAASAFELRERSLLLPDGNFVADHPFLYFLRDKQTGQILFQGKFAG